MWSRTTTFLCSNLLLYDSSGRVDAVLGCSVMGQIGDELGAE